MKFFIDANVLVAVLNKEQPLFSHAARILSLADRDGYSLYTSSLCLGIAYYFSEKKSGRVLANQKMRNLCTKIKIASIDEQAVLSAVANSKIEDFEDGMQYYAAVQKEVDYIITENGSDFYFSEIPVLGCKSFMEQVLFGE